MKYTNKYEELAKKDFIEFVETILCSFDNLYLFDYYEFLRQLMDEIIFNNEELAFANIIMKNPLNVARRKYIRFILLNANGCKQKNKYNKKSGTTFIMKGLND